MDKIEPGMIINCPYCKTDIAECVLLLCRNEMITINHFKFFNEYNTPATGAPATCPICGTGYIRSNQFGTTQIHLKDFGWV